MLKFVFVLIFILINLSSNIYGFNLSPTPNIIIRKPNLQTFKPQNRSSYFGFSIVLREKSIIIGAPRAQSTLYSQVSVNEPGAIFKCPLDLKRSTVETPEINCKPFVFDSNGNILKTYQQYQNEFHDYQWLGGAMDGGTKDSEPLLVCAPRFDGGERYNINRDGYLHGICYRSLNTLKDGAVSYMKMKPFTAMDKQLWRGVFYLQLGQLGFSAHISPNNDEYLMGAPGVLNWRGSAVRYREGSYEHYDIPIEFSSRTLLMNGYAVGSGYLDSNNRNQLIYLTTAPHESSYYGKVFLYRYRNNGIEIKTSFNGTQYGEFYGYALLVCDINGDGLDDFMVTAPQHRVNGEADIGAVYVYINKGSFIFTRQIIEAPFKTTARFGITISNLGDINRDGYKDIAIGAPLFNGIGAVVIYNGGPNGLQTKPSQIIQLPGDFKNSVIYFGHGLSKGVDIDNNGVNDLAIGAPNNEAVYIYRAYPVVKVTTNLKATTTSIKPETDVLEFEVCFQLDGDAVTSLLLALEADYRLKRLKFFDNGLSRYEIEVLALGYEKCQTFKTSITFLANHMFTPLEMELSYSLVKNGSQQIGQDFCTDCFIENPNASRVKHTVVKYNPGCKTDVCNVDLSINSYQLPTKIVIGSLKILKIIYNITNDGEKAFNTQVSIKNSLNLTLARIPSNCFEFPESEFVCDITKGVNFLDREAYLELDFDITNITDISEWFVLATVSSTGYEMNTTNNEVVNKIQFERQSSLEIVGLPMEKLLSFDEHESSLVVDYIFKFQNFGPSIAKNFEISLNVPFAFIDKDQQAKPYVNISKIQMMISAENQDISNSKFEEGLNYVVNSTELWPNLEPYGVAQNKTLFQICNDTKTTQCATSILKVNSLNIYESIKLHLSITFETPQLRELLKGPQDVLGFYIDAMAKLNSTEWSSLNMTKLIYPVAIEYRTEFETPLWIYLVAIIGGLLLLALLTFGLLKMGFFKRKSKEDMLQLLKEAEDLKRSKVNLENDGFVETH